MISGVGFSKPTCSNMNFFIFPRADALACVARPNYKRFNSERSVESLRRMQSEARRIAVNPFKQLTKSRLPTEIQR